MNFFNDYKKQIFTIVAVILAITAVITMGRKSHATFIDNTLGFVITPVQNVTSSVGDWFSKKIGNIKSDTSLETQSFWKRKTNVFLFTKMKTNVFQNFLKFLRNMPNMTPQGQI